MKLRSLWLLAAAVLLLAPDAIAGAKELSTEIAAARKSKDDAATSVAVKKSLDAYNASEDKAARKALLGELGKVVKDKKVTEARLAAVQSLVEIGKSDPDNAKACWKQMSRMMPNAKKTETASPVQLAVVAGAGELAQSGAVKALLELGYKAKDPKAAAVACFSMGGFAKDKKNRVNLLKELITIGLRTRPGQTTDKAPSQEARDRWQAVGPMVVRGLNRLTGNQQGSFEEWEALYKDNKKQPKVLFADEE